MTKGIVGAWLSFILLAPGCCATYKSAVADDAAKLAQTNAEFYKNCVAKTCGDLLPELVSQHIQMDAALACLVDTDSGKNTMANKSASCACSEGKTIDACKPWLGLQ
jgi:hypothetical protein